MALKKSEKNENVPGNFSFNQLNMLIILQDTKIKLNYQICQHYPIIKDLLCGMRTVVFAKECKFNVPDLENFIGCVNYVNLQ
jgi:hypothetical protein